MSPLMSSLTSEADPLPLGLEHYILSLEQKCKQTAISVGISFDEKKGKTNKDTKCQEKAGRSHTLENLQNTRP